MGGEVGVMATVRSGNYDIKGNEAWRVLKHLFVHKFTPSANFGGGPGLFNTLKLIFYHMSGRRLMCFKTRCPELSDALYRFCFRSRRGA